MQRLSCLLLLLTLAAGWSRRADAFALLGPFEVWQTPELYYDTTDPVGIYGDDVAGVRNLGEQYRWNVPTLFYSFDAAFLDYFGQKGVEAVEAAIKVFNDLPTATVMGQTLDAFPLDDRRINHSARALGLLDLKTTTMGLILEELGVAHAERFVWTMRFRELPPGAECPNYEYRVIKRNFDPVNWFPSSYVNGTLYTFVIQTTCSPAPERSEAFEEPVDPTAATHTSLSAGNFGISIGAFRSGLTRDDAGAMHYIYRRERYSQETFPAGTLFGVGGGGAAWTPVNPFLTNIALTNVSFVRPGVDRIRFVRTHYDSLVGTTFLGATNDYRAQLVVNGRQQSLQVRHIAAAPDFLFTAFDPPNPLMDSAVFRTEPQFVPSTGVPGGEAGNVPGTIQSVAGSLTPTVSITYSKLGVNLFLGLGNFLREADGSPNFMWGSFDGSTNPPVVYPDYVSLRQLEQLVLSGRR
jgi:hypothetical protein